MSGAGNSRPGKEWGTWGASFDEKRRKDEEKELHCTNYE